MGILAELRGYVTEDVNKVLSRFQPPPSAAALLQNELGSIPPAPFTLGQPATTGPFQLSSTVPLVVGDPNVFTGPASSSVQVQNSSGYLISVNTGGSSYTIQPFACSTIPTQNRTGATITTIAPLSNFGNSITLIWMIPGQNPPMDDGALTQGNIQSLGLLSAVNVLNANAYSQALPAPPVGYVYSLYSITFTSGGAGQNWEIEAPYPGGNLLFSDTGIVVGASTSLGGMIVANSVGVLVSGSFPATTTIRYDLFPVPIS